MAVSISSYTKYIITTLCCMDDVANKVKIIETKMRVTLLKIEKKAQSIYVIYPQAFFLSENGLKSAQSAKVYFTGRHHKLANIDAYTQNAACHVNTYALPQAHK